MGFVCPWELPVHREVVPCCGVWAVLRAISSFSAVQTKNKGRFSLLSGSLELSAPWHVASPPVEIGALRRGAAHPRTLENALAGAVRDGGGRAGGVAERCAA